MKHPAVVALCLLASGCAVDTGRETSAQGPVVTPVAVPAARGSGEPFPAEAPGGALYMSWLSPGAEETSTLHYARLDSSGWGEPRTVVEGKGWFVNWADFPSLAVGAGGSMAAHWLVKSGADPYAYDVMAAVSADGRSWSEPVRPHRDGTASEHGFVTLVPLAEEGFRLVWLDGRNMTGHGAEGAMTLRSAVLAPDGSVGEESLVDPRVCDCCPTDAVRIGDDVLVVYRDRSEDEIRDIWMSRWRSGAWSEPVPVHEDGWKIPGCPVNGPSVAVRGDRVACAWFTMGGGDEGTVLVAFSGDGGLSFGEPVRVDGGGALGRTDVVFADDTTAIVSWMEQREEHAEVLVRKVRADGPASPAFPAAVTTAARSSGFPKLARAGSAFLLAWTDPDADASVKSARIEW